jgi:DNA-binding transcriptional ArsR family regulator
MNEAFDPVWRALADPTRRALLDLLRNGPRTTKALAARFDMSRFGVMKHLGVLEGAGLVVVRRKGRERYNHLNAVPIQQLHRRWVSRYAESTASSLLELKTMLEEEESGEHEMKKLDGGEGLRGFEIAQEVRIEAPVQKVWASLTNRMNDWWVHRILEESTVSLDARLGGAFKEEGKDGSGAVWGTIIELVPNVTLRLDGPLGMRAGPVKSVYTYELEAADGGTLLKLHHEAFGKIAEETADMYNEGWRVLLQDKLKPLVEAA